MKMIIINNIKSTGIDLRKIAWNMLVYPIYDMKNKNVNIKYITFVLVVHIIVFVV